MTPIRLQVKMLTGRSAQEIENNVNNFLIPMMPEMIKDVRFQYQGDSDSGSWYTAMVIYWEGTK